MADKLSAAHFDSLRLTRMDERAPSRSVRLTGNLANLITVATHALPVLDSSLMDKPEEDRDYEVRLMVARLEAGEQVTPAMGQFKISLRPREFGESPMANSGDLYIEVRKSPLMSLVHAALEASVDRAA